MSSPTARRSGTHAHVASPNTLASPAPAYNTRSRSPSPAPPSPTVRAQQPPASPRSPAAMLTRSMQNLQVSSPSAALDASLSAMTLGAPAVVPAKAALHSTTGLVYDSRCLLHQANYAHVEKPQRASVTMALLQSSGLYSRCVHVPSRLARDDEIVGMAHTAEHMHKIDATATLDYKADELDSETEGDTTLYPDCKFLDSDTYVNRHSSQAARLGIGGLIDLMHAVLAGRVRNGFAVIRPPGHHADVVHAQGFCLYNNVAVAVQSLRVTHPQLLQRTLIIDWDVHHGNGTQNIFYNDPNVLYFSIHRYQGGAFYPHTGAHTECGGPDALGKNINVPLNFKGLGDAEYIAIFRHLLLPVLREFAPDLVVVSAGFDCAQGDPLGGMEVSSEAFGHMTRMLMDAVQSTHGRVVMALEGGYNVRAVSEAVASCTRALLGDPLEPLPDAHAFLGKRELTKLAQRRELFQRDLLMCIHEQRKHWKCLRAPLAGELAKVEAAAAAAPPAAAASVSAAPAGAVPAAAAAVVITPAQASVTVAPPPAVAVTVAAVSVAPVAASAAPVATATVVSHVSVSSSVAQAHVAGPPAAAHAAASAAATAVGSTERERERESEQRETERTES